MDQEDRKDQQDEEQYSTPDFAVAAFLHMKGKPFDRIEMQGGQPTFYFRCSQAVGDEYFKVYLNSEFQKFDSSVQVMRKGLQAFNARRGHKW